VLILLAVFSSGVSWLMSTNRTLAMSCFDGAGPRWLGFTNPRYGTPVRINNITGVIASVILIVGYRFVEGDVAKYFGTAVSFAIGMTLVTYLGIFPAFWVLRNKFPEVNRPYRVPAHRTVSIWLTLVVVIALTQLLAPGFGDSWFSDLYRPAGWVIGQGRPFYLTHFAVIGVAVAFATVCFVIGSYNRNKSSEAETEV
jgi:amino acid transporter